MHRRFFGSVSVFAAAISFGCNGSVEVLDPGSDGPLLAKAPKPSPMSVAMTVEDTDPFGVPYKVQSDGLGEYVNGVQGMQVEIDEVGNLQISPNNLNSTTAPQRTLRFDYSVPIDPLNIYRPDATPQWNFKIKSNKTNNGNPSIQDLGVNGNPASGCYNVTIAHATSTTSYSDNLNPAAFPQSTYVYITRTGISPATWTMVTNGPCQVNANVAGLQSQDRLAKGNPPLVFRGYYNRQFSIRLRGL